MVESLQDNKTRSLGMLLAVGPDRPSFSLGLELAQKAQTRGIQVYLYLLDDAILGADSPAIASLVDAGTKISACAYAARKRGLPLNDHITYGGLSLLNDIMIHPDRFVGFCQ